MRRWIVEALGELSWIDNSWEFVDVEEFGMWGLGWLVLLVEQGYAMSFV